MRTFETLIILFDLPLLVWKITGQSAPKWLNGLAVGALLIVAIHLVVERLRWQMIPAYFVSIFAGADYLIAPLSHGRIEVLGGGVLLALLSGSAALAIVLPVFALPKPTGIHSIGTAIRQWTIQTQFPGMRSELPRKLAVQFWYPSEVKTGRRSPYRSDNDAQGFKSHLRLIKTHSFLNVPLSSSSNKFPIVLFSPGWKGHLTQNTAQFEMLASHGFVVLSIEHPPAQNLPVEFDASIEENLRCYPEEAKLRAQDMSFVLDQIEQINNSDSDRLFTGSLDLSRVGMFGYSFGGAVTMETCWRDRRLKAGINMDGMLFGESADLGVEQPFLFMSSDGDLPTEKDLQCPDLRRRVHMRALDTDIKRIRKSLARYGGYYMVVEGMSHSNYSDRPLYSPLKKLTHAGSIETRKSMALVNDYMLAFFEQHLNGKTQPLLADKSAPYPEVKFDWHPVPCAKQEPVACVSA
ncbi:MAG TPA: hypothetical protein VFA74_07240 [Terriglobales bacterium]|nr:hypothetical protein [Terriglobales bacterium]